MGCVTSCNFIDKTRVNAKIVLFCGLFDLLVILVLIPGSLY